MTHRSSTAGDIIKRTGAVVAALFYCCLMPAAVQSQTTIPAELSRLPITEIRALPDTGGVLAIFLTGDGGWASLDKKVVDQLRAHGVAVVGLNTRPYLSKRKEPEQMANDLTAIARHYMTAWNRPRLAIVGYSRGADLMPFAVSGMPFALREKIILLGMLGLATRAGFEFHFEDIFVAVKRKTDQPTLPTLEKLRGMHMLCIYGADEKESGCRAAPPGLITKVIQLPGGHHYDDDFRKLGDLVLEELRAQPPPREN